MAVRFLLSLFLVHALALVAQGANLRASGLDSTVHARKNEKRMYKPEIENFINNHPSATWKARFNPRVHNLSKKDFRRLLGAKRNFPFKDVLRKEDSNDSFTLPSSFDAREKWSSCPSLRLIRDQGHCGSCWAFGAVEAFNDRVCIHTNDTQILSVNDLLSCCGNFCGDGCEGGWPYQAWQYFTSNGVVSDTCQSYFDKEGCKHPGCSPVYDTPTCNQTCSDGENWNISKHYANSAYYVSPDVETIMRELYENGPLEVDFEVYEDFAYYSSGVYQHVFGEYEGGHAVKLIGWGTADDGIDYWLIANSWNESWGEGGYFRIVRGKDECGIESDVVGGIPLKSLVGDNYVATF